MADDMELEAMKYEAQEEWITDNMYNEYAAGTLQWITKDRNYVNVREMDNQHLINTYRMIQHKLKEDGFDPIRFAWTEIFEKEAQVRKISL
jgi:hypothetical protein